MTSPKRIAAIALVLVVAGCSTTKSSSDASSTTQTRDSAGVPYAYQRVPLDTAHAAGAIIDSVFPMPEMVRRFRRGLPELSALQHAEPSQQALVARFIEALASSDRARLGELVLSRAEFAWLYFPNTRDATSPNGLSPERRWDQMTLGSEKGIARALARLGGRPITLQSLNCPNAAVRVGAMTLRDACTVKLRLADGGEFAGPLFGSVMEYAGRFKFVSYTNDM